MGRWGRFVALAAVAFALCGPAPQPRAKAEQAKAAKNQAQAAPAVTPQTAKAVEPVEPPEYYQPCRDEGNDRNSDLCAQWVAAKGAADAAYWAKWTFWFGLLGLGGLLVTLYYTRKAVLAAEEGTKDADTALHHAAEGNKIARDTAKAQLRAYLGVEPGGVSEAIEGRHQLALNLINNGQTPAYGLEHNGDIVVVEGDPRNFNPAEHGRLGPETATTDTTLGPQSNRFTYAYLNEDVVDASNWEKIRTKKTALVHYGYFRYKDAFGETRQTNFAYYHWGEELSDVMAKRCRFGNDAT
jgi:hypothetical protein